MLARRLLLVSLGSGGSGFPAIVEDNFALTSAGDGGWGALSNPTYFNGKTYFVYSNGASGDLCVRSYDHATETVSAETTVHSALGTDWIHNSASLLVTAAGRILVAYQTSGGAQLWIWRSSNVEDISAGTETNIDATLGGDAYTYPYLCQLNDETNAPVYLWVQGSRGADGGDVEQQSYHYATSLDNGSTWTALTQYFYEGANFAGYVTPTKTSESRVDFTAIKQPFPHAAPYSLYHGYWSGGAFHKTDGTTIGSLPFGVSSLTLAWDAGADKMASTVPVRLGSNGYPVILGVGGWPDSTVRAFVVRWTGSAWAAAVELCDDNENGSGSGAGIAMLNATTVYVARWDGSHVQLWRYRSYDGSATWTGEQLTSGATSSQRPAVVVNGQADLRVLYLEGGPAVPPNSTLRVMGFGRV